MTMAPDAPLFSELFMMMVVVATGTAWFAVIHPGFIWRMIRGGGVAEDPPEVYALRIRLGGSCFGIAGMLLLLLADLIS